MTADLYVLHNNQAARGVQARKIAAEPDYHRRGDIRHYVQWPPGQATGGLFGGLAG